MSKIQKKENEKGVDMRVNSPEWISNQHLASLAKDEKNRIFKYTYDNPEYTYTTEEKIEYQNYMIKLMKQVESGEITFEQSRAMVNDYFKEKSAIHSKPLPKKKK